MTDLDHHLPAIVAGDPDAFGRWVAGAERRIRLSLRSFAARVDTEAVVQETLLRVWQVAPRFQPDGRPDGLLRLAVRIARNLAISEVRRARVDPVEVDQLERQALAWADAHLARAAEPDPLLRQLIARCRELLPDKPARALAQRLTAAGDRPDAVLAEEVGMKLNTFLQNVRRARQALLDCLQSQGVTLPEAP
ncbi:MAG: sigma-70 family RNA polymerase sigma factor [Alphaproteobacteria bacterium]|nr:sigma-70 family RNA polymerase sigma factor [Alphaproteobacteria bacterium]